MTVPSDDSVGSEGTAPVDVTIVAVLVGIHVGALLGVVRWATREVPMETVLLAIAMYLLTGFSVTAGYHRLFAHRSYVATRSFRLFFIVFGAGSWQNSVVSWVADHRDHHRHTDQEGDPHAMADGFWHAHVLWLLRPRSGSANPERFSDLAQDVDLMRQHRFYASLAVMVGLLLPAGIAMTWDDLVGGLLIAGFLRGALALHATFCVNSVAHRFGRRPSAVDDTDHATARDNRLVAVVTLGEGYHAYHHRWPHDYRNGHARHHIDPTKWLIWTASKIGLASDLRRADPGP